MCSPGASPAAAQCRRNRSVAHNRQCPRTGSKAARLRLLERGTPSTLSEALHQLRAPQHARHVMERRLHFVCAG